MHVFLFIGNKKRYFETKKEMIEIVYKRPFKQAQIGTNCSIVDILFQAFTQLVIAGTPLTGTHVVILDV